MKLQQVHLRISDADTGRPTPVRLRITDADGNYYAPHGRLAEFVSGPNQEVGGNVYVGTRPWAYIDGACEVLVPAGPLRVEVAKGPEYTPIDTLLTLPPGKMALRLALKRWSDVRRQGWYSGDTRVHALSPHAALLEGQAEDVAVVNLLAQQIAVKDLFGKPLQALANLLAFSGQTFTCQTMTCGVAVNTHNVHPELGSLGLLHCHRAVYPLSFGGKDGREDWTLEDWCDQCHRKKGLVVWTNPQHQTTDFLYGEPLADLILGKVDAFEILFWEDSPFDAFVEYYRLLEAGLVVPLAGASGKDSNGLPLGMMRTYAQLEAGQTWDYRSWIEALRRGRTYVSNGPLLDFTINGVVPGSRWEAPPGVQRVQVRAEAASGVPFDQVELLWNGAVLAQASAATALPCRAVLEWELPVPKSGWLAVRCRGQTALASRSAPQRVFAHSSAVEVRVPGTPGWARPEAVQRLDRELEGMLHWARAKARCSADAERERLMQVFARARTRLQQAMSP